MLRVRHDDHHAFAELYQRYYRRLQNFFYGMSRDTQAAEDILMKLLRGPR
jgi:DNA-directed RNA polymerase specialized sigma24 family protein